MLIIPGVLASSFPRVSGAFESIATATPNGTDVVFSNIPSTFRHLQLRVLGRTTFATNSWDLWLQFNNDNGNNYTYHHLSGDGSAMLVGGFVSQNLIRIGDITGSNIASNIFGVSICDIADYATTNKNKTVRSISGYDANGSGILSLKSSVWLNTSAITSIRVSTANGSFASGSSIALYGIKGA